MNLKETSRHLFAFGVITIGTAIYGSRDQVVEQIHTSIPPNVPTGELQIRELQIKRLKIAREPTATATPTPEPTPTKTPTPKPKPTLTSTATFAPLPPTVAPVPTRRSSPTPTPFVIIEPTPTKAPEIVEGLNYQFADELIRLTNQFRKENGLYPFKKDERIMRAAQKYAKYCFENCDFKNLEHDLDGSPDVRLAREGYFATALDENMAGEIGSPQDTMNDWLNSPPHRTALLHTDTNDIGTGCYQGPYALPGYPELVEYTICVQDMASQIPLE